MYMPKSLTLKVNNETVKLSNFETNYFPQNALYKGHSYHYVNWRATANGIVINLESNEREIINGLDVPKYGTVRVKKSDIINAINKLNTKDAVYFLDI